MRHTLRSVERGSRRWSQARAESAWTERRPEPRGQMMPKQPNRLLGKEEVKELSPPCLQCHRQRTSRRRHCRIQRLDHLDLMWTQT